MAKRHAPLFVILLALLCVASPATHAADDFDPSAILNAINNDESDESYPGQEETDATLTRIDTAYQEAIKGLSAEQRGYLDMLDQKEREILHTDDELVSMAPVLQNCIDFDPVVSRKKDAYEDAFQRLVKAKDADRVALIREQQARKRAATFIDGKILNEHLQALSLTGMNELAKNAIAQADSKNCTDLDNLLAKYNVLPASGTTEDAPSVKKR